MHHGATQLKPIVRLILVATLLLGVLAFAAPSSDAATSRVVDMVANPAGSGYWVVHESGQVTPGGGAPWFGNAGPSSTAIAAMPDGSGYWVASSNGRIEAFGQAPKLRGVDHLDLAAGVIDMAASPSGRGLWLVAGDGGIFTAGDAQFHGSTGGLNLARPVVGMAPTADGGGYWLVAKDGGIFSFGNAAFLGSMGGTVLDKDIIAIVATGGSRGYMMVGADGGIFAFGATAFHGSLGGQGRSNVVGAAPLLDGSGYFMATSSGDIHGFGRAVGGTTPVVSPAVSVETTIESEIFERINADRTLRGLAPLRWDPELAGTAASWSDTMSVSLFRHSNLNTLITQLPTFNYAIAENIYWAFGPEANSAAAHGWLMRSTGHRDNILETAYTTVGIGVTCIAGRMWVTEQFGHPASDGAVQSSGSSSRLPRAPSDFVANTGC